MSKGSDINVGSIEEDIKILQELMEDVELTFAGWVDILNEREEKALKNLIQDYTRQKQINEEHRKENGGLREKVKELEEERQLVGIPVRNKRNGTIGIVLHQWKSGSIAVLENINPRVINTHDSWSTLEIITDEIKQTKTKDDSIAKQKIKDKIEELKDTLKHYNDYSKLNLLEKVNVDLIDARIDILQELLQEEAKNEL